MARIRVRTGWVAAVAAAVLALPVGAALPGGAAAASGPNGDWTQADHDASGNRANTTATAITAANVGQLDWVRGFAAPTYKPDAFGCGEGWTTPVLLAKKAYVVKTGRLVALDLVTGAQLWQRAIDTVGESRSRVFAVDGGRVFVGQIDCVSQSDPTGSVRVYNASTGAPVWNQPVNALDGVAVSGTRVVATGRSVGSGTSVRVFNSATGAVVWERFEDSACAATAVVVAAKVYYGECDPDTGAVLDLAAARLTDGVVAWRKPGSWSVDRGDAVGSTAKHVYAGNVDLNPATGATRFTLAGASSVQAVDATRVYAACGSVLCGYDRATGAKRWTSTAAAGGGFGEARAALAGALLYAADGSVLDPATGAAVSQVWSGLAAELSVGNGYVVTAGTGSRRLLDVYGLPGS
jgi:hypothetical protein